MSYKFCLSAKLSVHVEHVLIGKIIKFQPFEITCEGVVSPKQLAIHACPNIKLYVWHIDYLSRFSPYLAQLLITLAV